ncbi:MAG: hypothetical protein NVS9B4_06170 [Candidatus Acidiferrum sp.]
MVRNAFLGLLIAGMMAAPSLSQQANLGGTWKLNATKSDFGPFPGPDKETRVIEQAASTFKETVASQGQMGEQNYTITVPTDGKEVTVEPNSPMANMGFLKLQKISAAWEGSALVVNAAMKFGEDSVDVGAKNAYTVSRDGKGLTIAQHLNTPMGEVDRKLFFDKQDVTPETAMPSDAQARPSVPAPVGAASGSGGFSGTWKLNVAKSDFGQRTPPASRTDIIEDNGSTVKINSHVTGGPSGDQSTSTTLMTDGKESTVSTFGGREGKATTTRQGKTLVVTTKATFQENEILINDTWALGEDGKTLKIASHIKSPRGEFDRSLFFDKQ